MNRSVIAAAAVLLSACANPSTPDASHDADSRANVGTKTITVNSGTGTGAIKYGGIGFL